MIKHIILATVLLAGTVHATEDTISSNGQLLAMNDQPKYDVWNPPMAKKESGESCKDGNCFEKDGKVYKFFSKLRNKVKRQCKKL